MNSVTQYDGWETLKTVHSASIHDQSYELLIGGGLSQTSLILALVLPQPYASDKNVRLKAKVRWVTKMPSQ